MTTVVLVTVGLIAGLGVHQRRLQDALDESEAHRLRAADSEERTADLLYAADMRLGFQARRQNDPATLRQQLEKYRPRPGEPDRRGVEWSFLERGLLSSQTTIQAHDGPCYASVLSPDGRLLATSGKDGAVRIWDALRRERVAELTAHTNETNGVAFSPDGRTLATTSDDHTVRLWNAETWELKKTLTAHTDVVLTAAWSHDGEMLATGGQSLGVVYEEDGAKIRWLAFTKVPSSAIKRQERPAGSNDAAGKEACNLLAALKSTRHPGGLLLWRLWE